MEEANTIHDVIVIGGGLMGSSAAWHVSNQKSVLLIEKQGPNYDSGSSKGQARICRCSNIENDELWSYLHNCSVREVEKLIDFLNQNGEDRTMKDVYTTSPVSYIARLEDLNQLLANLAKQNVIFDIACTSEEGNSKFGVNLKKNTFLQRENNRNSGTINPQRLIQFLHKAITLKGNRILYKTKVEHIQIKDDLYAIAVLNKNGKTKVMYAKQVICAGGPFTGQLLQTMAPYFKDLISPKRVYLTFLKIKDAPYQNLTSTQKKQLQNGFPIIDRSSNELTDEFYAMIERYDLYNNPIIKIDTSKVSLFDKDTLAVNYKTFRSKKENKIGFLFDKKPKDKYHFKALPEAFNDIYGIPNDTLQYYFATKEIEDYGRITLKVNNVNSKNLIIELLSGKDQSEVITRKFIATSNTIVFDLLEPKNYTIRAIIDENKNNKWDTGSFLNKQLAEKIIYHDGIKDAELRANYFLEEIFKID